MPTTSPGSFGASARYQPVTSRPASPSGPAQSLTSSMTTASAVLGTAPAAVSRSIAVRCMTCDRPPTASVTNITS